MSSSRPRLVATDLDGTLLRSDGSLSARSLAVLRQIEASDCALVVVTGRPVRWIGPVVEQLRGDGVALVSNGAGVYDLAAARLIRTDPIPVEAAAEMAALLEKVVPDVAFAGERSDGYVRENAYRSPYPDAPETAIVGRDEVWARPLLKLLARTPSLDADGLLAAAREVVAEGLGTVTHSSRDGLLEISAAGVSKASALARLAADLGIDAADVVAFGDMPNDVPMLAWAGRSWAVANAHPEARAAADHVTAANDEDGVALIMETLFGAHRHVVPIPVTLVTGEGTTPAGG